MYATACAARSEQLTTFITARPQRPHLDDDMAAPVETQTWHYGLVARWWAEFNVAQPHEIAYYREAIGRFGEPAVDLGCGTGRYVVPLSAEGLDVDGVDVSADMIALARAQAEKASATPRLYVQPLHQLELERRYRTMYMCGVFGIGGRRDRDLEALRRMHHHLEPGGALLNVHWLPYSGRNDVEGWAEWLPGHRPTYPQPWPSDGNRKRCADGDEIELINRTAAFDPLEQVEMLEMRARLWHDGTVVREETYGLRSCVYFAQEVILMLTDAGFREVAIEGAYTGRPATPEDGTVLFVARK